MHDARTTIEQAMRSAGIAYAPGFVTYTFAQVAEYVLRLR